ncbi:MAG: hypothetical protein R3272_11865 [Candidatus Promineifilaceae bacterium]|nr:hypothetical protein [Candidatus Promineifilaceae bacterium]
MTRPTPRIRSLLRQAQRTAAAGKRAAALELYTEIVEEAPEAATAWLAIAELSRDPAERRAAYERVLALEPDNAQARAALNGDLPEAKPLPQEAPPAETPVAEAPVAETPAAKAPLAVGVEEPDNAPDARTDADTSGAEAAHVQREAPPPAERVQAPLPAAADVRAPAEVATPPAEVPPPGEEAVVCYRHPSRPTGLRCYTCDRPICTDCAIRTPVGYRCPVCVRQLEDTMYSAGLLDYLLAGVVAFLLSLVGGWLVPRVGFIFLLVFLLAPAAGTLIGRVAFRAARRRRGRWMPHMVAALVVVGSLLPTGLPVLGALLFGQLGALTALLWPAIYAALAAVSAFYQLR